MITKKAKIYTASIVLFVVLTIIAFSLPKRNKVDVTYIALGDSLAQGMNYNLTVDEGYTDFIRDYLDDYYNLQFYTKGFSKWGYETRHIIRDINNNKKITVDGKEITIKEALNKANLVTLTVGANDYIEGLSFDTIEERVNNIESAKKDAEDIANKVEEVIKLVKENTKAQIIVTGYYNPVPNMKKYKDQIDEVIRYYNSLVKDICKRLNVEFADVFDIFDKRPDFLPNPADIHPNKDGYKAMAKEVIKHINIDN